MLMRSLTIATKRNEEGGKPVSVEGINKYMVDGLAFYFSFVGETKSDHNFSSKKAIGDIVQSDNLSGLR